MDQAFISHTAHTDHADIRKQRLMREAGFHDHDAKPSALHLSMLVAVVVMLLCGATALMDDGNLPSQNADNSEKVIANR
jgi:hypothetical protein